MVLLMLVLLACEGGTDPEPIGPPVSLSPSAGNAQIGAAGQILLAPIAAKVSDAGGRGVPNIPVEFRVLSGGGSLESASARTNGAGVATVRWRVGTVAFREERVVAALLDTLTGALLDTAIFTATVAAGPPTRVIPLSSATMVIAAGQTSPVPMRVVVVDAFSNATPGVTVTWALTAGEGTLAAATSVSNAQGVATNSLTPGPSEADIEVRASLGGTSGATSFHLAVQPGITERFAFLAGGGFGIARTPGGQLIVSLIYRGEVERISTSPIAFALATVGGTPVVVAVDAAGQLAYAADMGTGVLSIVDVASMTKVAEVDIPGEAHSLAMSPRGNRVYVTNTANSVFAVDVTTRTIVRTSTTGNGPWGIAFRTTASDSLMYVTARDGGSITEIDMRTGNALRTLSVGGRPHGIAIAPSGSTLYVADDSQGRVLFVDRVTGTITQSVSVGGAFGIAITPDGSTLFVTANSGDIVVIDVASATVRKRKMTQGEPRQIIALPDGNTALAANLGGWIDLITR
jgi:YVTN family beta-propeller protein